MSEPTEQYTAAPRGTGDMLYAELRYIVSEHGPSMSQERIDKLADALMSYMQEQFITLTHEAQRLARQRDELRSACQVAIRQIDYLHTRAEGEGEDPVAATLRKALGGDA